jgi:hypothetical protein
VRLHIDRNGHAVLQTGGVTYQNTGTQIVVNPILSSGGGKAILAKSTTPFGGSQPTDAITGHASFHTSPNLNSVEIANDSPEEPVITGINVLGSSGTPSIVVNTSNRSGFSYQTNTVTDASTVSIADSSSSDILLSGAIDNPLGSTSIVEANMAGIASGSILSSGPGQSIETGSLVLESENGGIGTDADRVNVQMVQSGVAPSLTATAPNGNLYLDTSALNLTASPLAVTSPSIAAQSVDLFLGDGASQSPGQSGTTPQASAFDFDSIQVADPINIQAGTSTAVSVSVATPGDMDVGTIQSAFGDVTLTAAGAIDLGIVAAYHGTIAATAQGGPIAAPDLFESPGLFADTIALTATGFIGGGSDGSQPVPIVSSYSGPGSFSAQTPDRLTIQQLSGILNLGVVSSGGGDDRVGRVDTRPRLGRRDRADRATGDPDGRRRHRHVDRPDLDERGGADGGRGRRFLARQRRAVDDPSDRELDRPRRRRDPRRHRRRRAGCRREDLRRRRRALRDAPR